MNRIARLTFIAAALLPTTWAEVVPIWSTGVAVPGEKVALYLVDTEVGDDVFMMDKRPTVQQARLEVLQPQAGANPQDPNRGMVEVFPMTVVPDREGEIRISDVEVTYRKSGKKQTIKIPALPVVSTAKIKWNNEPIPFGTLWHTEIMPVFALCDARFRDVHAHLSAPLRA